MTPTHPVRDVLRLVAIATLCLVTGVGLPGRASAATTGLRGLAPAGFHVGTAVSDQQVALSDATYTTTVAEDFSSVTPDMAFKWGIVHPAAGVWAWTRAEQAVERAEANHQQVRGHTLLWDGALPDEVRAGIHGCDDARTLLREHITTLVGHFRGRVAQWDVVNEPFDTEGRLTAENPFLVACGESIIADAFRWAHAADPAAVLVLNEDGTLEGGAKADAEYALVRRLRAERVPIHAVGFEAHLQLPAGVPSTAADQLARYARLGLDVMVTEADVRMPVPVPVADRDTWFARQADAYRTLLDACLRQQRCTGFSVWGFTDRFSWVAQSLPGQGDACLLDDQYARRPAWDAVAQRLHLGRQGAALRTRLPSSRQG